MAPNGLSNGTNGIAHLEDATPQGALYRFEYLPKVLDIQIDQGNDVVEIELEEELNDDPTELCTLLENESVNRGYWISIANAYAKQGRIEQAIDVLRKGEAAFRHVGSLELLSFQNALIWMYLWKGRGMPVSEATDLNDLYTEILTGNGLTNGSYGDENKETRQKYTYLARTTINEAMRLDPRSLPLTLARGALYLIEASQMPIEPPIPGQSDRSERTQRLQEALNTFEAVIKASNQRSIMAAFGKARSLFLLGRYADAHSCYQDVLRRAPHQVDPDPRIGIGCCLWQLGHYDDARTAWERSLEVTPESKIAHIYLGVYWLHSSSQYPTTDARFREDYEKAISNYVSKAFKLDQWFPLSCATFASYFMIKKNIPNGQKLAYRAIRGTDVKNISSDAWYLIGRSKHGEGELEDALAAYRQADDLRGGEKLGYLPAKLGVAQILIMQSRDEMSDSERIRNLENAKTILEEMVKAKSIEAMEILGTVLAEEVFAVQLSAINEDKSKEQQRAIGMLEQVRVAWRDSKKNMSPDSSVLLNLARLYENDMPEKSLACLQQVEQMEIDALPEELKPLDVTDELVLKAQLREYLPPQLLNNMGVLLYQSDKVSPAREMFQTALNACVKIGDQDPGNDTDALVTTISFNLARTYEADGMVEEAEKVYRGLLERHPDYLDGNARLAYIQFCKDPKYHGEGSIENVYQNNKDSLEVRALYGWWCNKVKRKTMNVADDQEQRFYKITLQQYDKHDVYSLTGMGNIYLSIAREMRRETDDDRMKRKKMYEKAVEFYDKALQYDPSNAYAAQGVAIAMAEDRKEHSQAIQMFTKIREAIKDASVYINLGHVYSELKQFSRAVECYEQALLKTDPEHQITVLLYLGRVWFIKGRQEKNLQALKQCLEYTQQALTLGAAEVTIRFNIALVQSQVASLIITQQTTQRTLEDVQTAQAGLDEAIASFRAIAAGPSPPYPKNVIEQRANMSANTMKKQLERAAADQTAYEGQNAAKIAAAKQARDAGVAKREEEKRKIEEAKAKEQQRLATERREMQERDRMLVQAQLDEVERAEAAMLTTDSETGERKKREKRKRAPKAAGEDGEDGTPGEPKKRRRTTKKKARNASDDEGSDMDGNGNRSGTGSPGPSSAKPKRRLQSRKVASRGKPSALSAEFIDDSGSDDGVAAADPAADDLSELSELEEEPVFADEEDDAEANDVPEVPKKKEKVKKKPQRVIVDEDEDED